MGLIFTLNWKKMHWFSIFENKSVTNFLSSIPEKLNKSRQFVNGRNSYKFLSLDIGMSDVRERVAPWGRTEQHTTPNKHHKPALPWPAATYPTHTTKHSKNRNTSRDGPTTFGVEIWQAVWGLTTLRLSEEGVRRRPFLPSGEWMNEGVKGNGLRYADTNTWLDDCHSEGMITSKTRPAEGIRTIFLPLTSSVVRRKKGDGNVGK